MNEPEGSSLARAANLGEVTHAHARAVVPGTRSREITASQIDLFCAPQLIIARRSATAPNGGDVRAIAGPEMVAPGDMALSLRPGAVRRIGAVGSVSASSAQALARRS